MTKGDLAIRHLFASPPLAPGGALLAILLLAACSRGDETAEPTPAPSLTSQAMATTSTGGAPLTQGQWFIEETGGGASAAFGEAASEPMLTMVCNRNTGALTLTRAGAAEEAQTFTIEVGAQRAAVRMSPAGTELPMMQADIDPTQPIFAAFADPAESIAISAPGATTLRLPGHTGLNRVTQACS